MPAYSPEEIRSVTSVFDFSGTLSVNMDVQPIMQRHLGREVVTPEDYVHAAALVANRYGFAAFAGWPFQLEWMKKYLTEEFPKVQMVVNFPYGTLPLELALDEMRWGLDRGAEEIDSVIPAQMAESGDFAGIERYVKALQDAARPYGVEVKSIIRVGDLLKDEEELRTYRTLTAVAKAVAAGGGAFVKTCTGWDDGKATVRIIAAIKEALAGTSTRVKASGGITCIGDGLSLLAAGADRLAGRWTVVAELESLGAA